MASILDQDFPDEEEDDFNPAPEVGSDDEADEKPAANDDDDEDEPPARSERSRSRPQRDADDDAKDELGTEGLIGFGRDEDAEGEGRNLDDEDDEEDEEDEEDEQDDDLEGQPSRKRRKQHRRNQFIDVEAEVDEEDEEEPEEDDDLPGEEMHPDDLQELPPGADRDDRKHRELDRQREAQFQMDVEEEAARLKERYGRQSRATGTGSAIVPQRLLLPTTEDPRIFRMKCRPGKEKEVIISIQGRVNERLGSREPVRIYSAFERAKPGSPMSGMIYVEASRVEDVIAACEGITHVFMGTKPLMVPLEEMPDLLKVTKEKQLEPGMYVRIRRGLYSGDLAAVHEVEANGTEVILRIVPRLDYGLNEDVNGPMEAANGQKRKRPLVQRPPARLFSETEAKKRHGKYLSKQGGLSGSNWTYQNKEYIDGFLLEPFRLNALQTEDVNPTLEEVTKFATSSTDDGAENLDLAALAATLKTSTANEFLPGDKVEVFRGEQKGVTGHSVQVYGDVVKVKVDPGNGALSGGHIEAPIRDLRKLFREGDHVKVIGGSKYTDEVGMVVRTKDDRVTLLTDSNQSEITVFSKDLREATDSGGAAADSKFDLFDLVQLDAATVGCVIKVDRESLRILDQNSSVRTMLPSNISNKIEKRRNAVATDRDGNEMKSDDTIKEYSGEQKSGRVLHLHRNFVFAQTRERAENAGVWVSRHANVQVVAAKGGKAASGGVDLTKMNPALKQNGASPSPMPPPQAKGRDRLIGKSVKIRTGPNKGMIGLVKDASPDEAKVELHAKNKTLTMKKDMLTLIDPNTGNAIPDGIRSLAMGRPPPAGAGRTPAYAAGGGGRTPAYAMPSGGRTPAYAAGGGGRTPAWKQDAGARTPAYGGGTTYGGGGLGGQTAYGGATSYSGATSYGGGSVWGGGGGGGGPGGQSTWNPNMGGRTPAPSGSKTPAYGGMEAPTPGFNSAPTPGSYQDQPTPGGFRDQPTPGGFRGGNYQTPGSYQTPGGFPETPGPYSAETPGGDDGPRYD
ncbi:hypothetical protein LTR85_009481 [Meristemomyces frigidus]|nr:hypothetical protein LTR85_009481 [Meristemomyces frigidus]